VRYIDINDSEDVLRAIQMTDDDLPLDIVLHTPGGLVLAAMQIARAIREHKGKVTVLVPHYAMSGGTLISLAADAIVMSKHAVLGPVDPQLGQSPAASLLKVVEQKPIAEIDDQTLVMADVGRKAIVQVKAGARDLLLRRMPAEQADALAEKLSSGAWTHDYPIWANTAKELGLPVSTDMPQEVLELMTLYAQPVRAQGGGGVEYLPIPRQKEVAKRPGLTPRCATRRRPHMPVSMRDELKEARTRWKLLTLYQKFEHAVILILTGLISIVVALAVWNLLLKILVSITSAALIPPTMCVSGTVRHDLHSHHRAGIQALDCWL
jgi:ClpP class serine protease